MKLGSGRPVLNGWSGSRPKGFKTAKPGRKAKFTFLRSGGYTSAKLATKAETDKTTPNASDFANFGTNDIAEPVLRRTGCE